MNTRMFAYDPVPSREGDGKFVVRHFGPVYLGAGKKAGVYRVTKPDQAMRLTLECFSDGDSGCVSVLVSPSGVREVAAMLLSAADDAEGVGHEGHVGD